MSRRTNRRSSARRRSVTGAVLVMALMITSVTFWFARVSSSADVRLACTTPSKSMAQAIDARMRDPRTRVDHVRVVESHDGRYQGLFFDSANVRVDGVFVGIGTWASNFSDIGGFRGWSHVRRYYSLEPVNDLARTISSGPGVLHDPGVTSAAVFSQRCVGLATPA